MFDSFVRGHHDDLAIVTRDDNPTIDGRVIGVITPGDETRDDLNHFFATATASTAATEMTITTVYTENLTVPPG